MVKIKEPDFLIVGAMKAGTSSLADLLNQSEEIYLPEKELNYFDRHYNKPVDFYLKQFETGTGKSSLVFGEKTPTYSYDPNVPPRIQEYFPDIKLIWIFRDPVKRAYSNYWHAYKKGEELESFEQAVEADKKRYEKNIFKAYIRRSIYVEQLERYLYYFNKEQMHFLLFEDLVSKPQETVNKISSFLGVKKFKVSELPKSNKTYLPRNIQVEYYAAKLFGRSFLWKVIHKLNQKNVSGYPPINEETKNDLKAYFKPYNKRLSELTGLNLDSWNS